MTSIEYTAHALARMTERGVSRAQVEAVLTTAWRTRAAAQGRIEVQGLIERGDRPMLLRVIVERNSVVSVVVTVIATSKIGKYGADP
ncbi:MAG: hypothetical protein ABS84_08595 [Rubrivivax sp. SCN 71-131]|nr:MAG: hypothetical protein ABS84_08595 [Rubrivivax sp. SCN 71-131]